MARRPIALTIPDVGQFARALRGGLEITVSHQTLLNTVARAAGFRNFQHLKFECGAPETEPLDGRAVERALAWFDESARFVGWPGRYKIQGLCLWAIWSQLPDRTTLDEREISAQIDKLCTFRDAAQIRRGLVDAGLLTRTSDGAEYRRVGRRPGPNELAVIAAVRNRIGNGRPWRR